MRGFRTCSSRPEATLARRRALAADPYLLGALDGGTRARLEPVGRVPYRSCRTRSVAARLEAWAADPVSRERLACRGAAWIGRWALYELSTSSAAAGFRAARAPTHLPDSLVACRVRSTEHCRASARSIDGIDEHHPASRADRARRRGAVPRLGRARLDVPLPRAARARLPRLGAAREPLPARRRVRGGRALLRRGARRRRRRASTRAARARPSCARSATASRCRPAARDRAHGRRPGRDRPLPPRDERRPQGDQAAPRGRRRPPAARRSGATRPRRYCRERELRYRVDSSNPNTVRGLIRDEILPLLEQIHPAAARTCSARRGAPHDAARARRAGRLERRLEARRPRRRRPGRARARPAVARASPVALDGEVRWGPWRIRSELPGPRASAAGGRATGSPGARRRFRTCSSTRRCRARTARAGRSSCAATRSSPSPASSRRRASRRCSVP